MSAFGDSFQYCSSYLVLGYVKILAEERAKAYLLCFRIYGSKKSRSDQEYPMFSMFLLGALTGSKGKMDEGDAG